MALTSTKRGKLAWAVALTALMVLSAHLGWRAFAAYRIKGGLEDLYLGRQAESGLQVGDRARSWMRQNDALLGKATSVHIDSFGMLPIDTRWTAHLRVQRERGVTLESVDGWGFKIGIVGDMPEGQRWRTSAAYIALGESITEYFYLAYDVDDIPLEEVDRAMAAYERAILYDKSSLEAREILGWLHLLKGEHEQAQAQLEEILKLDPKSEFATKLASHIEDFRPARDPQESREKAESKH